MANTTTTSLKLTVQATGDNSGTWGQITNTNLQILEQAIGGYDAVGITSGATLSFTNGTLSNGKNQVLKLTGTITANRSVIIPDSIEKTYIVENATTGAHTVTFKTSSGSGVTFSSTDKGKKILYSDGTNVLEGVTSVGNLTTGSVTATGNITTTGTITSTGAVSGPLNADNLTSGTVPDARITGAYTGVTALTITNASNLDNLKLESTDADANAGPNLNLYRNSASPADNDLLGAMRFEGRNDNSQDVIYSALTTKATDVSDGTEDGQLDVNIMNAGTLSSLATFKSGETILNDGSLDQDFRVEGNGDANAFFVNAGTDKIGIGKNDPAEKLDVNGTVKATAFEGDGSALTGISAGLVNLGTTNVSAASTITVTLSSTYKKFFVTFAGLQIASGNDLHPNLQVGISGSISGSSLYNFQGFQYNSPGSGSPIVTREMINLVNTTSAALGQDCLHSANSSKNYNAQLEIDTGTSSSFPIINFNTFFNNGNTTDRNGVASGRILYRDTTTIDRVQLTTSSGINWAANGSVTVWGLK